MIIILFGNREFLSYKYDIIACIKSKFDLNKIKNKRNII